MASMGDPEGEMEPGSHARYKLADQAYGATPLTQSPGQFSKVFKECEEIMVAINQSTDWQQSINDEILKQVKFDKVVSHKMASKAERVQRCADNIQEADGAAWLVSRLDELARQLWWKGEEHEQRVRGMEVHHASIQKAIDSHRDMMDVMSKLGEVYTDDMSTNESTNHRPSINRPANESTNHRPSVKRPTFRETIIDDYHADNHTEADGIMSFRTACQKFEIVRKTKLNLANKLDYLKAHYQTTESQLEHIEASMAELHELRDRSVSHGQLEFRLKENESRIKFLTKRKRQVSREIKKATEALSQFQGEWMPSLVMLLHVISQHRTSINETLQKSSDLLYSACLTRDIRHPGEGKNNCHTKSSTSEDRTKSILDNRVERHTLTDHGAKTEPKYEIFVDRIESKQGSNQGHFEPKYDMLEDGFTADNQTDTQSYRTKNYTHNKYQGSDQGTYQGSDHGIRENSHHSGADHDHQRKPIPKHKSQIERENNSHPKAASIDDISHNTSVYHTASIELQNRHLKKQMDPKHPSPNEQFQHQRHTVIDNVQPVSAPVGHRGSGTVGNRDSGAMEQHGTPVGRRPESHSFIMPNYFDKKYNTSNDHLVPYSKQKDIQDRHFSLSPKRILTPHYDIEEDRHVKNPDGSLKEEDSSISEKTNSNKYNNETKYNEQNKTKSRTGQTSMPDNVDTGRSPASLRSATPENRLTQTLLHGVGKGTSNSKEEKVDSLPKEKLRETSCQTHKMDSINKESPATSASFRSPEKTKIDLMHMDQMMEERRSSLKSFTEYLDDKSFASADTSVPVPKPRTLFSDVPKKEVSFQTTCSRTNLDRHGIYSPTMNRKSMSRETISRDTMNREKINRESMSRETINRDTMNRDTMNREKMNREKMNRESMNRETLSMSRRPMRDEYSSDKYSSVSPSRLSPCTMVERENRSGLSPARFVDMAKQQRSSGKLGVSDSLMTQDFIAKYSGSIIKPTKEKPLNMKTEPLKFATQSSYRFGSNISSIFQKTPSFYLGIGDCKTSSVTSNVNDFYSKMYTKRMNMGSHRLDGIGSENNSHLKKSTLREPSSMFNRTSLGVTTPLLGKYASGLGKLSHLGKNFNNSEFDITSGLSHQEDSDVLEFTSPKRSHSSPPDTHHSPPNTRRSSPSTRRSPFNTRRSPPRTRRSPSSTRRSPSGTRRSPTSTRRSPNSTRSSPPSTRRSPTSTRRSPLNTRRSCNTERSPPSTRSSPPSSRRSPPNTDLKEISTSSKENSKVNNRASSQHDLDMFRPTSPEERCNCPHAKASRSVKVCAVRPLADDTKQNVCTNQNVGTPRERTVTHYVVSSHTDATYGQPMVRAHTHVLSDRRSKLKTMAQSGGTSSAAPDHTNHTDHTDHTSHSALTGHREPAQRNSDEQVRTLQYQHRNEYQNIDHVVDQNSDQVGHAVNDLHGDTHTTQDMTFTSGFYGDTSQNRKNGHVHCDTVDSSSQDTFDRFCNGSTGGTLRGPSQDTVDSDRSEPLPEVNMVDPDSRSRAGSGTCETHSHSQHTIPADPQTFDPLNPERLVFDFRQRLDRTWGFRNKIKLPKKEVRFGPILRYKVAECPECLP